MEQTTNKMFRGCPYEKENFENCSFCPNYRRCVQMKRERAQKRRQRKLRVFYARLIAILVFLTCITTAIIVAVSVNSGAKDENPTETTGLVKPSHTTKQEVTTSCPLTQEKVEPVEVIKPEIPKAELSAEGPSEEYYYHISDEDKVAIAKVVWAEARGECFEGKVAVAAVVLNRYYSGISYFNTESILAVVTQKNQFASIKNVTISNLENNPDCMRAVEAACKGWDPTRAMFSNGALYFYAPKYVSGYQAEIRDGIRVLVIGNHNFHYDFNKVS